MTGIIAKSESANTVLVILSLAGPQSIIVKVKFLTVPSKYGKNPVLERLKQTMKNLEVKYLYEFDKEIQQFQIHAKIIISDTNSLYTGSANFKDTSILYNLESGLLVKDEKIIKESLAIYDEIYNSLK